MEKAILVMDMPENCSDCQLQTLGDCMVTGKNVYKLKELKPEWCPLQSIPERTESTDPEKRYETGYRNGWNGCIESIQKERE